MRKTTISPGTPETDPEPYRWLDLESAAAAEVTSEDPVFPIESALLPGRTGGWRAASPGAQTIRLRFDAPVRLRLIEVRFVEESVSRTQEFVLRYTGVDEKSREVVRQQYCFSPPHTWQETERYEVSLEAVSVLELLITPEIGGGAAFASLAALRLA